MEIKIAVVGNCQARPIAQILARLSSSIKISTVAIVHLLKNEDAPLYENEFAASDFIISQQVADNYPCEFVRSKYLLQKYGQKVITIINLYYSGYNPDLRYIRLPGKGTLRGPLGDYHNSTILEAWAEGKPTTEAVRRFCDFDYNLEKYSGISEKSIDELRRREYQSDISIVDFINNRLSHERLFFTFNHPSRAVIEEMLQSAIKRINIPKNKFYFFSKIIRNYFLKIKNFLKMNYNTQPETNEPLDMIIPPVNCYSASTLNITFKNHLKFKGVPINENSTRTLSAGRVKYYNLSEIVDCYYKIYDQNRNVLKQIISHELKKINQLGHKRI